MVSTNEVPALSFSRFPEPRAAHANAPVEMPSLNFGTAPVDAKASVFSGTGLSVVLGALAMAAGVVVLALSTMGIGLLALVVAPIADRLLWRRRRALLRGQGVHVGDDQLPELHRCVRDFSQRLGMKSVPEVYVVEAATANGVAFKLGTRDVLLLTDDVIWGALQSGDPRSLGFVVGHELAHVALGHTAMVRGMMRAAFKRLSRCDEFTADNVAAALIGDRALAAKGVALLTVGPQLLPYVNVAALDRQAREVATDALSKKAERTHSHPLLFRRIANVQGLPIA